MKNIPELNALKDSFAAVIYGIIQSDGKVSSQERDKFDTFFSREFGLSKDEIEALFENAAGCESYDEHIARLKEGFANYPMQMIQFMKFLNETILSDGIGENEYALFESVSSGVI